MTARKERILIFIPTYNERENVEAMASQVLSQGLDADLLFLDDRSPDGTGEVLNRLAAADPRVRVIHRPGKLGVGSAHLDGITWAYDHRYDTLVTMDCDFTHSPGDLRRMLDASVNHDITLGSRYLLSGSLRGWNPVRRFLTNFGHLLTRRLLGMDYDATGAYRVYRLSRIPPAVFGLTMSRGYAFFFESLFLLKQNGCSITQVPIVLPARTYGNSKMSFWEPFRSLKQVMALFLASKLEPGQFRVGAPPEGIDPSLSDPQGWDTYWERKRRKSQLGYELAATLYRNLVIRRQLERVVHRHFPPGSGLLHAGCGSGQVDRHLQAEMRITALDVSVSALRIYRQNNPKAFRVKHGTVHNLPFPAAAFDGVYSLGVLEHFDRSQILEILREMRRVLRPAGKLVLFWPHERSTSVFLLGRVHWLLNDVLGRNVRLHPPEPSLLESRAQAESILGEAGFDLAEYRFGPGDCFVQAVIVAQKPGEGAAA